MTFFFNDTATTEIYTLSLHDALPILPDVFEPRRRAKHGPRLRIGALPRAVRLNDHWSSYRAHHLGRYPRSEEHTSELQSRQYLVCRLLLEKKKCGTILVSNTDDRVAG